MGWFSLVAAGAPVLGLVIGGPAVEAFGWRWLFAAQVPLCVAALVAAVVVLEEAPKQRRAPLDLAGAATFAVAIGGLLLGLTTGADRGWTAPVTVGALVSGALAAALLVRVERSVDHPILPVAAFRDRGFRSPIAAQALANFAYMGGFLLAPALVRGAFDHTVAQVSLVMLCRPLSFSLSSPIGGGLAGRFGERRCAIAGTTIVTAATAAFVIGASTRSLAAIVVGLVLSGVGLGVAMPSMTSSVANAVAEDEQGIASATQQMLTQVGAVAGMQLLTSMQGGRADPSSFVLPYALATLVAGAGVLAARGVRSLDRARIRPGRVGPAVAETDAAGTLVLQAAS